MSDAVGGGAADAAAESGRRPVLRVVRGEPTEEELAALVALLAARAAATGAARPEPAAPSAWTDRRAARRGSVHPGRGAWARSGRDRGIRTRADW